MQLMIAGSKVNTVMELSLLQDRDGDIEVVAVVNGIKQGLGYFTTTDSGKLKFERYYIKRELEGFIEVNTEREIVVS